MENLDFIEEEFKFIDKVKETDVYKRLIKLNDMLSLDEGLSSLAKERDRFYELAQNEYDEDKKREYLIQFKNKDDELKSSPIVIEYLQCYKEIKKLLTYLSDKINQEIKEI